MFIVPLTSMPSIEALNTIDKNDRTEEKDGSGSFGDILKQKIQSVKDLEMQSLQALMIYRQERRAILSLQ